jgi:membrane-bound ClpP family serine protease
MSPVFLKYLLLQLPGWLIASAVVWAFHRRAALPLPVGLALLGAWILKDLMLFTAMRRFYESEPAERRILRERGTAVTPLAPDGFVRIHVELWQARSERHVEKGAPIRVLAVQGLLVFVSPE